MTSISASLIVKNEATLLDGCLSSIKGQVDEIVVVDTGSSDATRDICMQHGARTLNFAWSNDFAAARNASLDACRCDWVLYIDADERLLPLSSGTMKDDLQPGWIAANVNFKPRKRFTPHLLTRLFRRHAAISFEGIIHETVVPSVLNVARHESLLIGNSSATLEHLGYDGEQSSKHERNLPLLKQCVLAYPDRVFYWHHLAEIYATQGRDDEARQAALKGIAAAERNSGEKSQADAAMLYHLLARQELIQGRDPGELLRKALALTPGNFALELLLGQRHLMVGSYAEALLIAEALLATNSACLPAGLLSYDEEIFGTYAQNLKLAALMKLGCIEEAAAFAAGIADPVR